MNLIWRNVSGRSLPVATSRTYQVRQSVPPSDNPNTRATCRPDSAQIRPGRSSHPCSASSGRAASSAEHRARPSRRARSDSATRRYAGRSNARRVRPARRSARSSTAGEPLLDALARGYCFQIRLRQSVLGCDPALRLGIVGDPRRFDTDRPPSTVIDVSVARVSQRDIEVGLTSSRDWPCRTRRGAQRLQLRDRVSSSPPHSNSCWLA